MANIVSGKSSLLPAGLERKVEEPEIMASVPKTEDSRKEEHFFNWRVARGYISDEVLKDPAFGENIFGYLAQNDIFYKDEDFYQKAVSVLEKRAVELVGEEKFNKYKLALKPDDGLTRQFRVLRAVFEDKTTPYVALTIDQVIWASLDSCLKDNKHIKSFGSSTIDYRLSISESMTFLSMAVMACEACAPENGD